MSRDSVNRGTSAVKNVCKPVQLDCLSTRILSWGAEGGGKDVYMCVPSLKRAPDQIRYGSAVTIKLTPQILF